MKNKMMCVMSIYFILLSCYLQVGCSFSKEHSYDPKRKIKVLTYEENLGETIRTGTLQEIEGLLVSQTNLNFTINSKCETPLGVAAIRGSTKIALKLLERGASPYFLPECLSETAKSAINNNEVISSKKEEIRKTIESLIAENKYQDAIHLAEDSLLPIPLKIDLFSHSLKVILTNNSDKTILPYLSELVSKSQYRSKVLSSVFFDTIVESLRNGAQNIDAAKKIIRLMGKNSNTINKVYTEETELIISTKLLLRLFNKKYISEAVDDYKELLSESDSNKDTPEIIIDENNLKELLDLVGSLNGDEGISVNFKACENDAFLDIENNRDERSKIFHLILFSRQLSYFEYHGPYACEVLD